jgi:hypothetical protein
VTPERVYVLLVEANPYADPEALLQTLESESRVLHLVDPTGEDMRTINRDTEATNDPTPPRRRSLWIAAVAAVVVLAVIGLAAFFGNRDSSGPVDSAPPTTLDADAMATADALDAVEALWAAVGENDFVTIQEITDPPDAFWDVDRRLWGFHAEMGAAGFGDQLGDCEASLPPPGTTVSVSCRITFGNPVFAAVDSTESVATFDYHVAEGRLEGLHWANMPDADIHPTMRAMVKYLRQQDEEAWLTRCAPAAYGGNDGVVNNQGLALTPECAGLLVPFLPDIARWVEAGQPDVWPAG